MICDTTSLPGGFRSFPLPGVHQRIGKYLIEDSGADVFFLGTLQKAVGSPAAVDAAAQLADTPKDVQTGLDFIRKSVRQGKKKKQAYLKILGKKKGGDVPGGVSDGVSEGKGEDEEFLSYLRILPASNCEEWRKLQVEDGFAKDMEEANQMDCQDKGRGLASQLMQVLWVEQVRTKVF